MFATIRRATFARRLPLVASASSWVSRMRTSASSAATKNPLRATKANTARIFKPLSVMASQFILELHLAENELQNVFEGHDADFAPVASQHHRQPQTAPLHPLQGDFQPQILVQIQRRAHE